MFRNERQDKFVQIRLQTSTKFFLSVYIVFQLMCETFLHSL